MSTVNGSQSTKQVGIYDWKFNLKEENYQIGEHSEAFNLPVPYQDHELRFFAAYVIDDYVDIFILHDKPIPNVNMILELVSKNDRYLINGIDKDILLDDDYH